MKFQSETDGLRHPDCVRLLQQQLRRITIDPSFASSRIHFFLSFLFFFFFFLDPILDVPTSLEHVEYEFSIPETTTEKTMGNIFSKRTHVRSNALEGTFEYLSRLLYIRRGEAPFVDGRDTKVSHHEIVGGSLA